MKNRWLCLHSDWCFTEGKVYTETACGHLIDDDGDRRLSPQAYNRLYMSIKNFRLFKQLPETLENK